MSNKRELNMYGYKITLRSRFCMNLVWAVFLTASSGCVLTGTSSNKQPTSSSTVQTRAVPEPTFRLLPASFDYVELIDRNHWLVGESNRVLKTEDGGHEWVENYSVRSTTAEANRIQGLSFVNERTGFLVVGGRLLRTDNGGANWRIVGSISPGMKVHYKSCRFFDSMRGWVVGMLWSEAWVNDSKIPKYVGIAFTTQDGGQTWQRRHFDLPKGYRPDEAHWSFNDVYFRNTQTGWLFGDRGTIFRTADGGETWHLVPAPDVDYQRVRFLDDRFGWATYKYGNSSWGIAVTVDGGERWKLLSESFVRGTWPVYAIFRSPKHGFSISIKMYETEDGGQHWRPLSGGDRAGEVAYEYLGEARDGTIVALGLRDGDLTALISTDSGMTWLSND